MSNHFLSGDPDKHQMITVVTRPHKLLPSILLRLSAPTGSESGSAAEVTDLLEAALHPLQSGGPRFCCRFCRTRTSSSPPPIQPQTCSCGLEAGLREVMTSLRWTVSLSADLDRARSVPPLLQCPGSRIEQNSASSELHKRGSVCPMSWSGFKSRPGSQGYLGKILSLCRQKGHRTSG